MSYIHIGQIYEMTDRPEDAMASYQKALQVQPNSPLVNNYVRNLYVHKGDLKSAGKYF
jgi:Tfp pilus assembly protein PilF